MDPSDECAFSPLRALCGVMYLISMARRPNTLLDLLFFAKIAKIAADFFKYEFLRQLRTNVYHNLKMGSIHYKIVS